MAAVCFEHVSKRFILHHERNRSFQEAMVNLWRHNGSREEFWALRDVNFAVRKGENLGIIGENGSGKSTTLKLISGVLIPTEGKIAVDGKISALLELGAGFHPDLIGKENIFLNGSILGFSRREMNSKLDSIIEFSGLSNFIDVPLKHYSAGMCVRLGFAIAIHVDFDILLIDEVLTVGDQSFQEKCLDKIMCFKRQGKTIVFVSHNLGTVEAICDRVLLLDKGRIESQGESGAVTSAYLDMLKARAKVRSPALR